MRGNKPLSKDEQILACIRTLSDLVGDTPSASSDFATSALHTVMGSSQIEFVRDDDDKLYPFVREEGKLWRGPLRRLNGLIQEARFDPEKGQVSWVKPWNDDPEKDD